MAYVNSLFIIIFYLWTTNALEPIYNLSSHAIWTNSDQSLPSRIVFTDGSMARFILLRQREVQGSHFGFGFGFYCLDLNFACYLSILFVEMSNGNTLPEPPKVVWSANRDHPVEEEACLRFSGGSLVLTSTEGFEVWSTYTTSPFVYKLSINKQGNLVLINLAGAILWQSFYHVTDTLLDGQFLREGKRLISSSYYKTLSTGLFYVGIYSGSLSAFVEGYKPSRYLHVDSDVPIPGQPRMQSVEFRKGRIIFTYVVGDEIIKSKQITNNSATVQILKLDADGGLRIYGWEAGKGWREVYAFVGMLDECRFPLLCGRYGLCQRGVCTCPIALDGVQYFTPTKSDSQFSNPGCRQIYDPPSPDVLSLTGTPESSGYYSSSYIKVLVHSPPHPSKYSIPFTLVLSAICAFVLALVIVTIVCMLVWQKKKIDDWKNYECDETLKQVSEIPTRFSYRELSTATAKFSKKLGGGGFGTVFEGVLKDGTAVAVKRLDRSGQGTKEFLAEVETMGKLHHIKLVRLIGFCASRRHRMLVYEYMSNGSLDRWIFCENQDTTLCWEMKKRIVADIAKGFMYLHEECTQKIAHLDVKPQNILLDDNFNAKLSDFGMSKLINRDESQVTTGIRGTLGYLAPERQHSRITVKADIYSFGIVLLEIISGRKILDYSQPDSDVHLLSLLRKKASENRLMDMVEYRNGDGEDHIEEAIKMTKLGMWCLNRDYSRRPSTSLVVKMLEGFLPLENEVPL
nr:G-type lectin S-receptor-like serine/threonine-protein kinase SD2-5 [Ziziphus jujuba var. spinosa]